MTDPRIKDMAVLVYIFIYHRERKHSFRGIQKDDMT